MKRRSFIKITGVLSISIVLPYTFSSCNSSLNLNDTLATPYELLEVISKDESIEIGNQYCKAIPKEAKIDTLISLLSKGNTRESLKKMITDDFNLGNTIIINGWVLAQTEARQCALLSILI